MTSKSLNKYPCHQKYVFYNMLIYVFKLEVKLELDFFRPLLRWKQLTSKTYIKETYLVTLPMNFPEHSPMSSSMFPWVAPIWLMPPNVVARGFFLPVDLVLKYLKYPNIGLIYYSINWYKCCGKAYIKLESINNIFFNVDNCSKWNIQHVHNSYIVYFVYEWNFKSFTSFT